MTPETLFILALSLVVAVSCALLGVFLVLRRVSLMSDAISHAILLGIVVGYFLVRDLHSPWLIILATLAGVLTVTLTEMLIKTQKVKEDASIGLVFPFLFALAVLLLTKYASNVHLDTDVVVKGNLLLTVYDTMTVFGYSIPNSLVIMSIILLVNILFVLLFYKELKLVIFDKGLAVALGFLPSVVYYALMTLVSVTAVGAFDAVGSVLVVALMIAPPAAAYLLTHSLSRMILLSVLFGAVSAVSGYWVSFVLDASIAGCMAVMSGVLFSGSLLFAPQKGLLAQFAHHKEKQKKFRAHLLLVHLLAHEKTTREHVENTMSNAVDHMRWTPSQASIVVKYALMKNWITLSNSVLKLTRTGRLEAKEVMVQ